MTIDALIADQVVTFFDTVSQMAGRWIPVRYDGRWHRYTRNANESISGASNWHADNGRWPWVERWIDALGLLLGQRRHCLKARLSDRTRAAQLLASDKPKESL